MHSWQILSDQKLPDSVSGIDALILIFWLSMKKTTLFLGSYVLECLVLEYPFWKLLGTHMIYIWLLKWSRRDEQNGLTGTVPVLATVVSGVLEVGFNDSNNGFRVVFPLVSASIPLKIAWVFNFWHPHSRMVLWAQALAWSFGDARSFSWKLAIIALVATSVLENITRGPLDLLTFWRP